MAEGNGQQDNLSRLDRIERAMEFIIDEHEMFRQEHKMLLRSQVLQQESLETLRASVAGLKDHVDHLSSKIDLLVDGIDRDHRGFHERLNRLEQTQ
jgi:prefoldin subunit 5